MQKKGFLYWLFSNDKKPQYVDSNGLVQDADATTLKKPDGQLAHLQKAPDGWKDTLVKYARNNKYLGLFRDYTVPMRFVKDGAKILREFMWRRKGMEAILYFGISKLNRSNYPLVYEPWYTGELDFSKIKDSKTNATVQVIEGGLSKLLKANENTVYEISISTDAQKKNVYNDGLPFTNKIAYSIFDGQEVYGNNYYIGMGVTSTEGTTQGILNQDQQFGITNAYPNDDWYMKDEDKNITVKNTGSLTLRVHNTGNVLIRFERYDKASNTVTNFIVHNQSHTAGQIVNISINQNISLGPNQFLYLKAFPQTSGGTKWYTITGGNLDVAYDVTFTPSFCEGLDAYRLFENIVDKMTGGKYTVSSTFLQSLRDTLIFTSGQALRKWQAASVIKTSLSDFFKHIQRYGLGLGIENDKIIIEKHSYFFQNDIVADIGVVDDATIEVAEDLVFNTIKVGYKNQEVDKVNGRDEFNVTQLYSTPHTRVVKELDLVSPYDAGMYRIEATRIDLSGKDTTDNAADNDVFVLHVTKGATFQYYSGSFETAAPGGYEIRIPKTLGQLPNGSQLTISASPSTNNGTVTLLNTSYLVVGSTYLLVQQALSAGTFNGTITGTNADFYRLSRPAYTSITGLLHSAEAFNTEGSPKRALLNNGAYIRSILDYQDTEKIKFETGERNSELSTTIGGVTVAEKADVVIGSLADKLFLPYYFSFRTRVPGNFLAIIKSKPYSRIAFTKNGKIWYGYLWDGGIKPATNDEQTWKLLAAPNNTGIENFNTNE